MRETRREKKNSSADTRNPKNLFSGADRRSRAELLRGTQREAKAESESPFSSP